MITHTTRFFFPGGQAFHCKDSRWTVERMRGIGLAIRASHFGLVLTGRRWHWCYKSGISVVNDFCLHR